MGERKGLSKYYPPDFDPAKLSRVKGPKNKEVSSNFMLPCSIRCLTCGEYMAAGLKFNAKKSTADETYLGGKIFRFSMKCKSCPQTLVIKTDPEHGDYLCESGAKRNYAPWRAEKAAEEEEAAIEAEQASDAMQALENKTLDARQEMEDLDALDELRASKARAARISTETLLEQMRAKDVKSGEGEEQGIDDEARLAFAARQSAVRRIDDDSAAPCNGSYPATETLPAHLPAKRKSGTSSSGALARRVLVTARKKAREEPAVSEPLFAKPPAPAPSALQSLSAYGRGEESDSSSASGVDP
jgi:Saf4/Yju2 protein